MAVSHLFAHQFNLIGRQIVGKYNAVSIENQTSAWRYRLCPNAIALRQSRVVFVSQDLQIKETAGNEKQQHTGNYGCDDAADDE